MGWGQYPFMEYEYETTTQILRDIAESQQVQRTHSPHSYQWQAASYLLRGLFAEMALREPKGDSC